MVNKYNKIFWKQGFGVFMEETQFRVRQAQSAREFKFGQSTPINIIFQQFLFNQDHRTLELPIINYPNLKFTNPYIPSPYFCDLFSYISFCISCSPRVLQAIIAIFIIQLPQSMGGAQSWSEASELSVSEAYAQQLKKNQEKEKIKAKSGSKQKENPTKEASVERKGQRVSRRDPSKDKQRQKDQEDRRDVQKDAQKGAQRQAQGDAQRGLQRDSERVAQRGAQRESQKQENPMRQQELKMARKDRLKRVNERAQLQRQKLQKILDKGLPPSVIEIDEIDQNLEYQKHNKFPKVNAKPTITPRHDIEGRKSRVGFGYSNSIQMKPNRSPRVEDPKQYENQFKTLVKMELLGKMQGHSSPSPGRSILKSNQNIKVKTSSYQPNYALSLIPSRKSVGNEPNPRDYDNQNQNPQPNFSNVFNKPRNIFDDEAVAKYNYFPQIQPASKNVFNPEYHAAQDARKARSIFAKKRRTGGDLIP